MELIRCCLCRSQEILLLRYNIVAKIGKFILSSRKFANLSTASKNEKQDVLLMINSVHVSEYL